MQIRPEKYDSVAMHPPKPHLRDNGMDYPLADWLFASAAASLKNGLIVLLFLGDD